MRDYRERDLASSLTRARDEVHVVTSISPEIYCGLPPVPAGQTAGGGWLLFAYLANAEQLAEVYALYRRILDQTAVEASAQENVRLSKYPSAIGKSLAHHLKGHHNQGSDVHWGNDGFCVDVALHHPKRAENVTIGVLCDMCRFTQAEDVVEWDVFRTGVLEAVGWKLLRLWTPHFFRDAQGQVEQVLDEARTYVQSIVDPDEPDMEDRPVAPSGLD